MMVGRGGGVVATPGSVVDAVGEGLIYSEPGGVYC